MTASFAFLQHRKKLAGSPIRSAVSSAIIKLNEEGVIQRLKTKWWKKERGGGACQVLGSFPAAEGSNPVVAIKSKIAAKKFLNLL